MNKCGTHYWQQKYRGHMWPVGEGKSESMNTFSTTKTCAYCRRTKDWKAFVIGADGRVDQCRDCYRDRLLTEENHRKSKHTMTDVLDFIDQQTQQE